MPVNQKKQDKEASTQLFLKVAEVKDNIVSLKDGSVRGVVKVSSVNFELKSEQEQNSIIYGFQDFLNSLEFPIQILIKSRKLDIEGYLEEIEKAAENQKNELLQKQIYEYVDFIAKMVELADIMAKDFYVIIPTEPYRAHKINPFKRFLRALNPADSIANIRQRQKEFSALKKGLTQRVNSVTEGLSRCGLHTVRLNTHQLIELFYQVYNPSTSHNEKLEDITKLNIDVPSIGEDNEEKEDEK